MSVDTMTEAQRAQAEARELYRQSLAAGDPLTGAQLAERFGRRERWGQERIAEARAEARTSEPSPGSLPPLSPMTVTPPSAETAETDAAPAETAETQPRGAAAVAWLALVLGVGASVGANILHTLTVIGSGGGSVPQVIGAAFWPVALVVAIEVMARVRWPRSIGYALLRFAGVGAVAVVAAIVSYRHMSGLLLHWGEDPLSAHLGPIAVDGLVTVGALALLAIHKTRKGSE